MNTCQCPVLVTNGYWIFTVLLPPGKFTDTAIYVTYQNQVQMPLQKISPPKKMLKNQHSSKHPHSSSTNHENWLSTSTYCTVLAVLVGNNGLSHSVFTLFICFRPHRRYYTTVKLELANSRTVDSRSLELSTLEPSNYRLSMSSLVISPLKSRVISFSQSSLEVFARSNLQNSRTVGPKVALRLTE
jgi:hypothetical protein